MKFHQLFVGASLLCQLNKYVDVFLDNTITFVVKKQSCKSTGLYENNSY